MASQINSAPAVFFTADAHLNHANLTPITRWDNQKNIRSFPDEYQMNWEILRRWNSRVNPGDTVFHLGDFVIGNSPYRFRREAPYWESQLNGKIIHVLGNHDNRGFKKIIGFESAIFRIHNPQKPNKRKITAFLTHRPTQTPPDCADLMLSGHVHQEYDHSIVKTTNGRQIPNINVGLDCWDFYPVSETQIYEKYQLLKKNM